MVARNKTRPLLQSDQAVHPASETCGFVVRTRYGQIRLAVLDIRLLEDDGEHRAEVSGAAR